MQLEIILSEVSHKNKYPKLSLICGIQIMAQVNLSTNRNRLTDIENKLVVDKAEGEEKSGEGEIRSL